VKKFIFEVKPCKSAVCGRFHHACVLSLLCPKTLFITPLAGASGPERTASVPVLFRLATHFFRLGDMVPQAINAGTRLGSYMVKKRYARIGR
jgi:hypothetical protein